MAFRDLTDPKDIKAFLLNVLSRTGGKKKEDVFLFHYTNIDAVHSIVKSGYIWPGTTARMNDFYEGDLINFAGNANRLFFSSFSKAEENLAMYKMYAPNPDGVMLKISYADAERFTESKKGLIVRDYKLTDEEIDIEVYWAAVCYKGLHSYLIKSGDVVNVNILNPMNEPDLIGLVKLYGWEYEKEVRLCVIASKDLKDNERIALQLPEDARISVVTGPGFDRKNNRRKISLLRQKEVEVSNSEYDNFVDLGSTVPTAIDKQIEDLEKQVAQLQKENRELQEKLNLSKD